MPAKHFLIIAILFVALPLSAHAGDALELEASFDTSNAARSSTCVSVDRRPALCIRLTNKSRNDFANWTRKHVGQVVDIKVNDEIIISPKLLTPLTGGVLQLTFETAEQADTVNKGLQDFGLTLTVDLHDSQPPPPGKN